MRLSSYLVRRGGNLYFRMRVPADVRPLIGRQELKRSLRTGDRGVARQRAAWLASTAFSLISQIRTADVLTDDDIARFMRAFYAGQLDRDEAIRTIAADVPEIASEAETAFETRDDRIRKLKRDAATGRVAGEAVYEAELDLALHLGCNDIDELHERYTRDEIGDALMQLKQSYMRGLIEAEQRAKERDDGDWTGEPSDPRLQQPGPAAEPSKPVSFNGHAGFEPTEKGQLTPQHYVETVIAEKTKDKPKPGLASKYRLTMKVFEELVGAQAMDRYTERDIVAFKDALLRMPTYPQNIPGYLTAWDAIRWNEAQLQNLRKPTKSPGTINESYLPYVRETFKHAADNGHVPVALGQRVRVSRTPGQKRGHDKANARYRFSSAKLQKIFSQPLFLGAKGPNRLFDPGDYLDWSWRFWLPLAMLFMGIRPQELGQLEVTDVVPHPCGYPCLNVTTISDADDVTDQGSGGVNEGKLAKSPASVRQLPIHPVLLDLGFLERVENVKTQLRGKSVDRPEPRVFPEWKRSKTGRYAPAPSRFFNRDEVEPGTGRAIQGFLARAGVKTDTTVLYSLRHNYKQALVNGGFGDAEQDLLMGHAGSEVDRIYGSRQAYTGLIEKVRHLRHDGLDLNQLFAARGRSFSATPQVGPEGPNVVRFEL
jgi:hypothetical protein